MNAATKNKTHIAERGLCFLSEIKSKNFLEKLFIGGFLDEFEVATEHSLNGLDTDYNLNTYLIRLIRVISFIWLDICEDF